MSAAIPVTLISGYLGTGKTTLVNALLRNAAGRRLAVLVNEFGSLPIDGDLIEAREANLISISGGCICCSFGSDLVAALIDITGRGEGIDHLLIETSGVALPGSIVQSIGLLTGLAIDGVVVLADAETVRERACDRYMSDTVRGQLAGADLIVLNKIDLAPPEQVAATSRWLAGIAPGARILPARNAGVPIEVILGGLSNAQPADNRPQPLKHQTADFATLSLEIRHPVDADKLAHVLADPRLGLLRAKGFVRGLNGEFVTLHVVGRRASVVPAPARIEGHGRLVCIGLAAGMDRDAIEAAVAERHASSENSSILPAEMESGSTCSEF